MNMLMLCKCNLHFYLNPDVCRSKNACIAARQMPHPQINNHQAGEEKAAAKQDPAAA